ncbi:hypothetical protein MES5069_180027 [Mesorhizobium escarrei]|uniref:Uncharacterized protein n=1 Tax=Mesorhizobium escarrei TaxID=666018 RepID=A0ABM9DM02_9HYPH|nr:hypothetical protein MES5069_180027 [Mesorhizobium escarrei]
MPEGALDFLATSIADLISLTRRCLIGVSIRSDVKGSKEFDSLSLWLEAIRLSMAMISSISNIVPGMGAQGDAAITQDTYSRSSCRAAWRMFSFSDMVDLIRFFLS